MAQTGFTPILLYASNTASSVPSAGNLTNSANGSEVAVNTADKRLFTKDGGGSVVELGTNPSALTVAGSVTLSGGTANGVLYLNGSKVATSGTDLVFNGTVLRNNAGGGVGIYGLTGSDSISNQFYLQNTAGTKAANLQIGATGILQTWVYGGTSWVNATTIDSSGNLGIGTSSPTVITAGSRVLEVSGAGDYFPSINLARTGASGYTNVNWKQFLSSDGGLYFRQNSTDRMVLDSSGNLGLGVTPSAGSTHIDVSNGGAYFGLGNGAQVAGNAYFSSSQWLYKAAASTPSARIDVNAGNNGSIGFFTAPSGTAGNPISFGDAKMTLDVSGNLGVETTSPTSKLTVGNAGATWNSYYNNSQATAVITTGDGGANNTFVRFIGGKYTEANTVSLDLIHAGKDNNIGDGWRILSGCGSGTASNNSYYSISSIASNGSALVATERARITSGGYLLVGKTATGFVNSNNFAVEGPAIVQGHINTEVSGSAYTYFIYNTTQIGGITQNGTTGVAYNTTSDYRLKDNPQPLTGSGAFIDALQPKTWNWKTDGSRGVGFIAHEAQAVSPGSVVGEKDAVDADGKPVMQAMEYGSAEFIANIIAELKALRARVAALEGV